MATTCEPNDSDSWSQTDLLVFAAHHTELDPGKWLEESYNTC